MRRFPRCFGLVARVGPVDRFGVRRFVERCQRSVASGQRVATFRVDVTPPLGSPLVGGWSKFPLLAVDDPLLAKGIVLDDNGQRYVLCAVDYCEIRNSSHTFFASNWLTPPAPLSRVAVQSLHQHTAPMIDEPAQALLDASAQSLPSVDVPIFARQSPKPAAAVRQAVEHLVPFDAGRSAPPMSTALLPTAA